MTAKTAEERPAVLVLADHYLPGFRAGGPIRTLHNLIEALNGSFRFLVITRDRDLGEPQPYPEVRVDAWNKVGPACVYYASPSTLSWRELRPLLRQTPHDLLYLNSFFSPRMTILPLLARRLSWRAGRPVVLAPRGEFSPEALALKSLRKRLYLQFARSSGLLADVRWQATNEQEKAHICSALGVDGDPVRVVPNLPSPSGAAAQGSPGLRAPGPLRIVFLSRIAPMKNLDFLLEVLRQVGVAVSVTVHGPVVDQPYWAACLRHVAATFAAHDLFVFPTRGENYGHVIAESLAAGTAVIVSDRTPWQADPDFALTVLPLDRPAPWIEHIEAWARLDPSTLALRRSAAAAFMRRQGDANRAAAQHEALFQSALASARPST